MSCNCEGKKINISMGCCQPVLAPIENYYTKYEVDKLIESATTSGCCITPEEVDEKIEEAISGISVSGVTEEELNNAIASAKTEIEAEIPTVPTKVSAFENDVPYLTEHQSLSGYATEQWVLDKHYITGVDLSNYSTTDEVNSAITQATSGKANSSDVYLKGETSGATEIQNALNAKADPYSAGTGISIIDNVISTTGGGGSEATVSALTCYKDAIPSNINYSEGSITTFYLKYSGSGGWGNTSFSFTVYNNGVDKYKTIYANYNNGVFTAITTSDSAYTATIENGYIKFVLTSGCSFKSYSSSYYCTPFLIEQYSSGTTSDVMVNTVYDAICRLSDNSSNNFIKKVDGHIGDGRLHLYSQGTLGTINTSIEIASNTINTDGGKLNVHFSGTTSHDAVLNTGSGNYCELFSVYEYSKSKDDIEMTINSAYTGTSLATKFTISFIDSSNNRHQFEIEYNITANTISTPSGYETYGTIVDTLSTDYKVKFLPNSGYKIASFRSNSCLIGGVDSARPNDYISNLVTTTSYDYNGQEVIDDLYSKIPKIWCGTQAEYEQILVKDPNTLYLIHN